MTNWRYTCDIKKHIPGDVPDEWFYNDENFKSVRDAIVAELKGTIDHPRDARLCVVVEGLERASDTDEFNEWLDELYDWADARRVWMGL